MSIIIGVMEEGLIYAIMALGLYITYKILDFPDLSVDGTFPMGAAVTAMLILKGVHPALTLLLSFAECGNPAVYQATCFLISRIPVYSPL